MDKQTFIFMGRSGCGKGTQVKLLTEYLKADADLSRLPVTLIETGAKFRAFSTADSYSAKLSKAVQDVGGLQPAFLAILVWAQAFVEQLKGDEHVILDGVCRILIEAQVMDTAFKFYERGKVNIIYLDLSPAAARERLLARGRGDDDEAEIARRLAWFEEQVVPALNYYRANPDYNFLTINAEQPIEAVHTEIIAKLYGQR